MPFKLDAIALLAQNPIIEQQKQASYQNYHPFRHVMAAQEYFVPFGDSQ
jgi:hypothetical protein